MKPISLKSVALAAPIFSLLAMANCASDEPVTNAGAAGTGTAGTTAGTTSSTAGVGTGGSSGGSVAMTAGTTSGGTGTAGTGIGGTGTAGTGTAGTAGTVGTAGTGGTAGGGSPCKAGGDMAKCIDEVAGKVSDYGVYGFKSSWFITGCADKQGHDCVTVPTCPSAGATFEEKGGRTLETFTLGGVAGQHYKVTFQFNGLSEAKEYKDGTRDSAAMVPANPEAAIWDTFYRDGTSIPSNYNVMRLSVFDDKGAEARHYYMNSFPAGGGWESHRTFLISYTKSIVVVGGGKITYLVQDSNCHAIDNCGAGNVPDDSCNGPRSLPGNDATTMLPAMYKDPKDGVVKGTASLNQLSKGSVAQPWHSQASHLTITKIEETADPVTMNY